MMKKILVFVATVDGKINNWGEPIVQKWSSEEDQQHFNKIWNDSSVIILGSSTFEADPIKPNPAHHLIIMTRTPAKYKHYEVAGQLEFTNQSPAQVVAHCEMDGLSQMLIAAGPRLATSFFKAQLIDELWLTIEPMILGTGSNFVIGENLDINLKLLSVEKVNEQGTLITKYEVIN